jgi:type IV secretory pathway VirB4 component
MEDAFKTTLPYCKDKLLLTRNMDTTSLSTTFPFTSSELSDNQGVLYGINAHNESLVIFDRYSLENANMLILATSGAGKSFAVKLEILRSLMFDCQVIILDPENEYEMVTKSVGGNYLSFSAGSANKINPFQIARPKESTEDEIGYKYLFLMSLLKIMIGEMNPMEEATMNRALVLSYRQKGITEDPTTHVMEPPRMEDLYRALIGMEEAVSKTLAARLERYVMGGVKGIFDQQSNIDINAPVTVFTLRDTADEIRPIIMFMILDFVWNQVRKDLRKRMLVVDEAWYLMRYEDSAKILQGFVKRARKYYFGVSIISQNVDDFLGSAYGKAIITNSALKLLLKQSPAAINQIAEVFYLSQGEKQLLLSAGVGEGIFFAGMNHVAIKIIASADEHALATSKPAEIIERKKQADIQAAAEAESNL